MDGLTSFDGWERVEQSIFSDFYKSNIRYRIDEETEDHEIIEKDKLIKIDFTIDNRPLDVRFAVSSEKPTTVPDDIEMDYELRKERHLYVRIYASMPQLYMDQILRMTWRMKI